MAVWFGSNPAVTRPVHLLSTGSRVRPRQPLVLYGHFDTGKTYVLIVSGTATENGCRVTRALASQLAHRPLGARVGFLAPLAAAGGLLPRGLDRSLRSIQQLLSRGKARPLKQEVSYSRLG